MHPGDKHAVAEVFGHVEAFLLVIPASASASAFGVNFASHKWVVVVFLWHEERLVGKLLALEETVAVFVDVALQIRIDGSQTLCQLGGASEAYVLTCGS